MEQSIFRKNPINLTKLEVLRIAGNFLEGEIPRELGDLHYMTALNLESNHLTGSIPPSIYNITTLRIIALSNNNLTGELPTTICDHLPNLEGLFLSENIIGGIIPPNFEKCKKLKFLSLSENKFTGTIPRELGNITNLAELYLGLLHFKDLLARNFNFFNLVLIYIFLHLTGEIPSGAR